MMGNALLWNGTIYFLTHYVICYEKKKCHCDGSSAIIEKKIYTINFRFKKSKCKIFVTPMLTYAVDCVRA